MAGSLLKWIGLASVLALVGFGIGALAIVKDRIEVTVQEGNSGEAPDPLALVRDDLQQLHADLDAIAKALGTNMTELARVLGDQAETTAELQAAVAKLATNSTANTATSRSEALAITAGLAKLDQELRSLRVTVLNIPLAVSSSDPSAKPGEPPAVKPTAQLVAKPAVKPTAQPVAKPAVKPAVTATDRPTPDRPKRKPAFLSFNLPSRSYEFDKPQHYRILSSLSRVGFDGKSTLHDFSGVTSKVRGDFYANLASEKPAWKGSVSCEAEALKTGVDGRDEGLREHLLVEEHPEIKFVIESVKIPANGVDKSKRTVSGSVSGKMTIRGKTLAFELPVKISVDKSQRLLIEGQQDLKMSDYGVPVPSQMGVIGMEDGVKMWVSLRARSVGAWDGVK